MARGDADYRDTVAARMLSDGLRRVSTEGLSQRELAKRLGYKQSVVLSHMALGRVPIPVDRVPQFAEHLGLDPKVFLSAVLRQRYPDVAWDEWDRKDERRSGSGELVHAIEMIARSPIDELTPEQMRVMREVAADPNAGRRWLSVHEVEVIELLRDLVPDLPSNGISRAASNAIKAALKR